VRRETLNDNRRAPLDQMVRLAPRRLCFCPLASTERSLRHCHCPHPDLRHRVGSAVHAGRRDVPRFPRPPGARERARHRQHAG
jgi:hypothetical protein